MESQIKTTVEITKYKHSGSNESFERVKFELEQDGFEYIESGFDFSAAYGPFETIIMEKIEPLK